MFYLGDTHTVFSKGEVTRGATHVDSSTKVLSHSMASHTPIRARLRFLKSTLALMLKAKVCFSAFDKISGES